MSIRNLALAFNLACLSVASPLDQHVPRSWQRWKRLALDPVCPAAARGAVRKWNGVNQNYRWRRLIALRCVSGAL